MSHGAKRLRYVLKRLLQAVPIVLAIIIVNFFLLHMAEGDAVDVLAGEAGSATPEYMAELRAKFGLDQPLPVQLAVYLEECPDLRPRLLVPARDAGARPGSRPLRPDPASDDQHDPSGRRLSASCSALWRQPASTLGAIR